MDVKHHETKTVTSNCSDSVSQATCCDHYYIHLYIWQQQQTGPAEPAVTVNLLFNSMLGITQGNICHQSLVSILGLASHRVTSVISLLVVFHSPLINNTASAESVFITLSGLGGYTWCIISIVKALLLKIPAGHSATSKGHNHWFTDCIVLKTQV